MKKLRITIGDPDGNTDTATGLTPDLGNALLDGIRGDRHVQAPQQATTFNDLTETLAQTSHLIQHLENFRKETIAAADRAGGPHADRKAIGIAAGMPRSRLYRILDEYGRPRDRKQASE
ncbi:hypothetical protein [Streptomyces swartbergensis]|uniref:Uncharacterized protein n=1 Tax=Streptomyces swartbergensis TaxID=487165 RepID=A0A243SAS3_9ACTN|nr:hypothetical protein [Streptomyces swartbergensis]OUD04718.1 hypothetical protein CA983_02905 [Streptomyces swartbergensis]